MSLGLVYLFETQTIISVATTKDIATTIGVVIALGTLIIGVYGYFRQRKLARAEYLVGLRRRFAESEQMSKIQAMLTRGDDPELASVELARRLEFLGFFEEVALLMNSGFVSKEVAHYMFGYYAIECRDSEFFWHDMDPEHPYWALFRYFVSEMEQIDNQFVLEVERMGFERFNKRLRF